MEDVIITALCGGGVSVVSALISYKQGKKQSDANAFNTAFDALALSIETMQKENEARYNRLKGDYEELKKENIQLRSRVFELENQLSSRG